MSLHRSMLSNLPRGSLLGPTDTVLVTGAAGFVGTRVVALLQEYGVLSVRCFVRPSSRRQDLDRLIAVAPPGQRIDVLTGDLLSRDDCRRAVKGVSVVLHVAAGIDKAFAGAFMNSALTTRNLIEAFLEVGQQKRFVNVSSFAVYSNRSLPRGALLDESCPLEDDAQTRSDAYGFGKLKQDEIVQEYGAQRGLPYVIVRPGSVFGPGKKALTGRVGVDTFGFFAHIGGSNPIPLTYVDNCAEAIVLAGVTPGIDGEVFNVVDDDLLTSRQLLQAYRKHAGRFRSVRVPYPLAYALSALWEEYSRRSHGQLPPAFNRRRCAAEWKGNRYSNAKLKEKLGWTPRVPMDEALKRFLAQFGNPEETKV
jgi:nucleoside-diphosphate-sugar epimerase